MTDQPDESGPDATTLNRLMGMLPGMAKGVATKKLYGRGMKVGHSKYCQVCEVRFGATVRMENQPLIASLCDEHRNYLENGYTALRFGSEFIIGKFPQWPDRSGQVVPVTSKKQWDAMKKCYHDHFKKNGDAPAPP